MADEDESVVIDLNDDTPPEPTTEKKPPPVPGPGAAPATPAPQAALADLQRQMQEERDRNAQITDTARRIANERDQAIAIAQAAEARGMSTYELYNENQIKAVQDKMESLAAAAEQAMQDGDFKRASTLNLQIGRLGGNLAVLERDQAVLQQQREQMGRQPAQPQPRQQQPAQRPAAPSDPFERAIANRTPATQEFLRKHKELVRSDGTLKASAIAAHERARDEGFEVDTPGYFEYIERSLAAQIPAGANGNGSRQHFSAPVDRGAGGGPGSPTGPRTFTMTAKMRRLAAEQGVPEKEWAQNYVRLLNEGRITPIT